MAGHGAVRRSGTGTPSISVVAVTRWTSRQSPTMRGEMRATYGCHAAERYFALHELGAQRCLCVREVIEWVPDVSRVGCRAFMYDRAGPGRVIFRRGSLKGWQ